MSDRASIRQKNSQDEDRGKLPPLERYFRILEALAAQPAGLSLMELATILMLPKGTVHRLLMALQKSDLVSLGNEGRPRYVLAARARRLAYLSVDSTTVAAFAERLLRDFSVSVGETCYIARLEDATVRSIAMASPETPWRGFVLPGKVLQPHATASGKAIMAFQPPDVIDRALSTGITALTEWTKVDRAEILEDYAQIRESGLATCIQEVEVELAAFAMPIEIEGLGVRYSVGVLGPHSRIGPMIADDPREKLNKLAEAVGAVITKAGPL